MIRSFVLAASAIALFAAAPAGAGEIHIKTAGKAPAVLRAEIVKAASTVCWQSVRGEAFASYLYPSCIRASVNDAVDKLNNPELVAYNAATPAPIRAKACQVLDRGARTGLSGLVVNARSPSRKRGGLFRGRSKTVIPDKREARQSALGRPLTRPEAGMTAVVGTGGDPDAQRPARRTSRAFASAVKAEKVLGGDGGRGALALALALTWP